MTIKQSIKALRARGYRVQAKKRSDGGYLITRIGRQTFKGARGNAQARTILGTSLSTARAYQLNRLVTSNKAKRPPLPKELKKEIRKVQQIWRKSGHETIKGTIKTSSVRYTMQEYGVEEAYERLKKAKRYATGYAYEENVRWFTDQLRDAMDKLSDTFDTSGLEQLIEYLEEDETIDTFKEEWISVVHDILYDNITRKKGAPVDQSDINNAVNKIWNTIR